MFKKVSLITSVLIFAVIALPVGVLAHVTVKPAEVATSSRQIFNVSVPNENEAAEVIGVRLVIPEGVKSARPNAKPGWKVDIKKEGEGESAKITEITWTSAGSTIPVNLRDDFFFGGQAPADTVDLQWKAYETYSDGTVVAWDQAPSESEESTPYSVTKVVNDAGEKNEAGPAVSTADDDAKNRANLALALGALALVVSIISLARPKAAKK